MVVPQKFDVFLSGKENPIRMDELAVPLFQETSMYSDVVSGERLDKNPSETVFGVFFWGVQTLSQKVFGAPQGGAPVR